MRAKNGGFITIGDASNIRLNIFIFDNRDKFFEGISISSTIKAMPLKVLNVRVSS